jgi:hypothetical protein
MPMSPRLLRPRNALNPKSISGLQLWLDASDSSSMTMNGTTVSEWRSKAGTIAVAQSTAGAQPTLTSNYYAGRSALTFDGGDAMYASSAPIAVAPSTSFIVIDEASAVSFAGTLVATPASGDDFGSASAFVTTVHDNGAVYVRRGSNTGAVASAALIADSTNLGSAAYGKRIIAVNCSSTTAQVRVNAVAGTADSAHTVSGSSAGVLIGGRFISSSVSGLYRFNGKICEVLHYSSSLSSSQMSTLEKWLAVKWGITL